MARKPKNNSVVYSVVMYFFGFVVLVQLSQALYILLENTLP
ncbi:MULTISPECIES: hypothetical protein [Shewanella]|nr:MULTISPECIES: hypothetical protein [Shewanella]MDP5145286.1 hypothetical protein [Shewanella sp. ULN5]